MWFTFVWMIIIQLQCTSSLRDLILSLPPAARLGETVTISCTYHLQGEELYTVKLYKGRHEFLQIVPEKSPPVKTFPRKGVQIKDVTLDGVGKNIIGVNITLTDVNLFTTGLYGCEASADSSFHTQLVRKYMTVLVQPAERPEVSGFKNAYQVGEKINMTCSLKNTFPSANLTWFINGHRIDKNDGKEYKTTFETETAPNTGLLTSHSVLSLHLQAKHFPNGRLTGKCVASILTMHWQSSGIEIKEEHPKAASVLSGDEDEGSLGNSTKTQDAEEIPESQDSNNIITANSSSEKSAAPGHNDLSYLPWIWIMLNLLLISS